MTTTYTEKLLALITTGALRVTEKTDYYAHVYYTPALTAADVRIGAWRDGEIAYRAAMVGDLRLTGMEHSDWSDADLVAEALAEAGRTGATGAEVEAVYTYEDGVWTWQSGTDTDLGDALEALVGEGADPDEVEAEALRLLGLVDGATECAYCGHVTTDGHDVPNIHDDAAWSALASAHAHDCEWIATRAHRVYDL